MAQTRDGDGLALEALAELRILGVPRAQHLERDLALERGLEGLVHRGHAALAEGLEDLVAADGGTGGERHVLSAAPVIRPSPCPSLAPPVGLLGRRASYERRCRS